MKKYRSVDQIVTIKKNTHTTDKKKLLRVCDPLLFNQFLFRKLPINS